jgi:hypothetical protein
MLMKHKVRRKAVLGALAAVVFLLTAGLGGAALRMTTGSAVAETTTQGTTQQACAPHINPSGFTTKIDNEYFPLKPGTIFVYRGNSGGNPERDEMSVTHSTKKVMGVKCVVVDDRVWAHGPCEVHLHRSRGYLDSRLHHLPAALHQLLHLPVWPAPRLRRRQQS